MRVMEDTTVDSAEQQQTARRRGFADWPLRTKLLVTMLPLAVLPLLLLTFLGVRSTSEALTANVEQNARTSATSANARVRAKPNMQIRAQGWA